MSAWVVSSSATNSGTYATNSTFSNGAWTNSTTGKNNGVSGRMMSNSMMSNPQDRYNDLEQIKANELLARYPELERMFHEAARRTLEKDLSEKPWYNLPGSQPRRMHMMSLRGPMPRPDFKIEDELLPYSGPMTYDDGGFLDVPVGNKIVVSLGDKTRLHVNHDGTYRIEESDSKVVYKGCKIREFNKYLNASDLLEEFVKRVGEAGVKSSEFMGLPVELFIRWLVLRAAQTDGEVVDKYEAEYVETERRVHQVLLPAPPPRIHGRCLNSGRFLSRMRAKAGVMFSTKVDMLAFAELKVAW